MKLRTPKNALLLFAVATLMITASGCGACRGLCGKKPHTVARPVYTQCAPVCAPSCGPSCAPSCESCGPGNVTTYGMPAVTTFSAP